MMDYLVSRENFLDVGEQYSKHLESNMKEWIKFIEYYNDVNNTRKAKDEEYKRDQFIGEELDWKMLADNLSLFQSNLGDPKEMQGFDPNGSLVLDQSIRHESIATPRQEHLEGTQIDSSRRQTLADRPESEPLLPNNP